jgi:polysaccharide export outer membrane protein
VFAQGAYIDPGRLQHVAEYRLRVDDQIEFVYRLTRIEQSEPYELNVGDEVRVESFTDPALTRDLVIQPDGTITLRLLGQVRAARQTVPQLRRRVQRLYSEYYNDPSITVTPLRVNTRLEDLRATVDGRAGFGGQSRRSRVSPDGTIQLPAIGSVQVQGLTLDEARREINARYAMAVKGIEITPVLSERAPRFVYVLGEVRNPGRFALEGPTTMSQALALAGSWNVGANLNQVVVFRRDAQWHLTATMVNIRRAMFARDMCPDAEIWLCDSDVIVVPQSRILQIDNFIDLVFTRGVYGVVPFQGITINMAKLSTL